MVVENHVGNLDVVHFVVLQAALFLRLDMLRMRAPGALAFLMLELDDGDALAVLGPEPLVRDVAGNGAGDLRMRSTSAMYSSCRPGMRRERKTVTIMAGS